MTRYVEVPLEYFTRYIHNRVHKHNKNFLSVCSGIPGEGKSYSMLRIAEELDPNFNSSQIILSAKELMEVINSGKLKRGSVLVIDEFGTLHNSRAFQSTENRMISFLIQTFRRQGFILLGCCPSLSMIDKATRDLLHCHFMTQGINKDEKVVYVKPMMLQPSQRENKIYYKYLRVGGLLPRNKLVAVTELAVPIPSKEIRSAYEAKRDQFQLELNQDIMNKISNPSLKSGSTPGATPTVKTLSPQLEEALVDWKLNLPIADSAVKRGCTLKAMKQRRVYLSMRGLKVEIPRKVAV